MPPAGLPPEIAKQPMLGVLFAFVPAGVDGGEAAALIARVVAQLDVRVAVLPHVVVEPVTVKQPAPAHRPYAVAELPSVAVDVP